MEVTESTQRHTRVRLKQIELVLFTLCDGSFFCDVAAEISAEVMVRRQITRSLCRIGPVVGMAYLWDPPYLRVLHMSRELTKQTK